MDGVKKEDGWSGEEGWMEWRRRMDGVEKDGWIDR